MTPDGRFRLGCIALALAAFLAVVFGPVVR